MFANIHNSAITNKFNSNNILDKYIYVYNAHNTLIVTFYAILYQDP